MTKLSAALILGVLLLGGCSGGGKSASSASDPYAGLNDAMLSWKTELAASDVSCRQAPAGSKCEMFQVSCKAQRTISPDEAAKGVTAKLVADLGWSGYDDKGGPTPASAAALFTRTNGAWQRTATKPVNPETCADLSS